MDMEKSQETTQRGKTGGDDEIDLLELFLVIWRRKWLAVGVLAAFAAAAAMYLALAEPVYESKALVRIGQVQVKIGEAHEVNLVEDPDNLGSRLLREFGGSGGIRAYLHSTETINRDLLEIRIQGTDPASIENLGQKIVTQVLKSHEARFKHMLQWVDNRLEQLDARIEAMENMAEQLRSESEELSDSARALMIMERSRLASDISALEGEATDLASARDSLNTYPTEALTTPESPDSPIEPRRGLIMSLSMVLGLMAGVFSVFLTEFISSARQRMRQEGN